MAKVIAFNTKKIFLRDEVNDLLPVLIKVTREAKAKTDELLNQLYSLTETAPESKKARELESEVDEIIIEWQNKVSKLGGITKGLWLADFDSGDGYFCWKFPEDKIAFWHRYSDGYSCRVSLEEREKIVGLVREGEPDAFI